MACRSKLKTNECKHGAPWTNLISPDWMKQPLLICKGLAKQIQLRCSGQRNSLGQVLQMRNEEWVNGAMPALCVAFRGSNADVRPAEFLPIITSTHASLCQKNCVKKHALKKSSKSTQRTQTMTAGYFGGRRR